MSIHGTVLSSSRVLLLLVVLALSAAISVPAGAQSCAVGWDVPSGGRSSADPINAAGSIVCLPTILSSSAELTVRLVKDGTVVASATADLTGETSASRSVSAACSAGSYHVTVISNVPGYSINPSVVASSNSVLIDCGASSPTINDSGIMTMGGWPLLSVGFGLVGSMGAMNPATTSNGKTYVGFADGFPCVFGGCNYTASGVTVSGFTFDPGPEWLVSATALGVTKSAASAYYYYDNNGTAMWTWYNDLWGFSNSGTTPYSILHK
jgi:hypothetical protein